MRLLTYDIVIEARPELVYEYLTDATALLEWIAQRAESNRVADGRIRWHFANGAVMLGRYLELTPPRRLVFSYGWQDDDMGVPPESTIVEIDLVAHPRGTHLKLVHRLLPDSAVDEHRHGWDYFLRRLALRVSVRGEVCAQARAGSRCSREPVAPDVRRRYPAPQPQNPWMT